MFTLFTDTDCDITPKIAEEYGYKLIYMPYVIDGKEYVPYVDYETFEYHEFYEKLRKGTIPKTYAINPYDYINYFEPEFKKGNDVVYVHFSKAMSGTFNALNIALEELKERYPDRKCYLIDTKGITILAYQIVIEIGKMVKNGATLEEIIKWSDEEVLKYAVYFFANDLKFFQKSGRVSGLSAFFGSMLGIHPVIYIGDDGKMTNLTTVRGRQAALKKLVAYVEELAVDIDKHKVVIGHSDATELAEVLGDMLKEKFGENLDIEYIVVNPTIGSHCGPSSVGVSFYAKHR